MRLIDADAVIEEVEGALNKGVYKTMIIQLIKNAPSCCSEIVRKSINECKTMILDTLSSVGHMVDASELIGILTTAGYDLDVVTAARKELSENGIISFHALSTRSKTGLVFELISNQHKKSWLEKFLTDCCDVGVNYRVTAGDLIAAYKEWARSVGEYEGRRGNEIYSAMIAAGFERIKPRNVSTWLGLRLKTK